MTHAATHQGATPPIPADLTAEAFTGLCTRALHPRAHARRNPHPFGPCA